MMWDRQTAIDTAINVFGLNGPEGVETDITYDPSLDGEGSTDPEIVDSLLKIRIGPKAFHGSFGWLGSSIAHELCHGRQLTGWTCFKSERTEDYRERDPKKYSPLSQGGQMMEVEAYNLELSMTGYFELTESEIEELNIRLSDVISGLSEENQILALSHNYECVGGDCYKSMNYP